MDEQEKTSCRTFIKSQVLSQSSHYNVIEGVKALIPEDIFWKTSTQDYIVAKYIKYCRLELASFAREKIESASFEILNEFLYSLNFSDLRIRPDCKILGPSPFTEHLNNVLQLRRDEEKRYILQELSALLLPDVVRQGDASVANLGEKSIYLTIQDEYLLDYKTQFLTTSIQETVFHLGRDEEFDQQWNIFAQTKSDASEALTNKHLYLKEKVLKYSTQFHLDGHSTLNHLIAQVKWFQTQVNIEVKNERGRKILIVEKPVIVLSKYLERIEDKLKLDASIGEIRFYTDNTFYADKELHNEIWHGKNVLVNCKTFCCILPNIEWDVSGKTPTTLAHPTAPHGTKPGESGQNGNNGESGESGGNVAIISEQNKNMKYLIIISHGGNGSNGQNGGDGVKGANGADGYGIALEDIKMQFPNPIRWFRTEKDALEETISALLQFQTQKKLVGISEKGHMLDDDDEPNRYAYIQGCYLQDLKFEFCYSRWKRGRSVYLLFKGKEGQMGMEGGNGGIGGMGGKGGYHGDINVINHANIVHSDLPLIKSSIGSAGKNGVDGKNFPRGNPGMDGLDAGYADMHNWTRPNYFPPDNYQIIDNSSNLRHRVWCHHFNLYREIIKSSPNENSKSVRTQVRPRSTMGKQTISQKQTAIDIQQELQRSMSRAVSQATSLHDLHSTYCQQSKEQWETAKQKIAKVNEIGSRDVKLFIHCQPQYSLQRKSLFRKYTATSQERIIRCNCSLSADWPNERLALGTSDKLKNLLKRYQGIPKVNYWKESSLKLECIEGEDEALHILVRSTTNIGSFSSKEVRKLAVDQTKLRITYVNDRNNDQVLLKLLGKSLNGRIERLMETIRKACASSSPMVQEDYRRIAKAMRKSKFDWKTLLDNKLFENILSDYFKIILNPDESLTIDEITLIALSFDHIVVFYEREASGRHHQIEHYPPDVSLDGSRRKLDILRNEDGTYAVLLPEYLRDWQKLEKCLQKNLPAYFSKKDGASFCRPHHESSVILMLDLAGESSTLGRCSEIITRWPSNKLKLFHDILVECNIDNKTIVQLLFEIISQKFVHDDSDMPWFNIILGYDKDHWKLHICLTLLADRCRSAVPTKTEIEKYQLFLETVPQRMLQHLAVLIHANSTEYYMELKDTLLKGQLQELMDAHPWLLTESRFDMLEGMITINQWSHQIGKVAVARRIKELVFNVDWEKKESRFREAFYYYYTLEDTEKNIESILRFYNKKIKSRQSCTDETQLWWILRQFASGKWRLANNVHKMLQRSSTVNAFVDKMKAREDRATNTLDDIINAISSSPLKTLDNDSIQIVTDIFKLQLMGQERRELNANSLDRDMQIWRDEMTKLVQSGEIRSKIVAKAIRQIDSVIKVKFNHSLRTTQKLAILFSTSLPKDTNLPTSFKNLLLQVNTGEGKSYIVMAAAIVRGLLGQKSDIITSSSLLALRDANKFREIYELFGLTVGNVTSEDTLDRSREYTKTIVYGEASQFQRDYLMDHFYNKNVRGSRKFENIVIDEVDSMFLDKGNDVLYLSHSPAGLESLDIIFSHIWQQTINMLNCGNYKPLDIYSSIISSLFPVLFKSELHKFQNPNSIWDFLMDAKIINFRGFITATYEQIMELESSMVKVSTDGDTNSEFKKSLEKKLKQFSSREPTCSNFLKPFVELHLLTWIRSAYMATQYKEGVEYVLHTDYFSSATDKIPNILVIDLHTGTDLRHTQWGNGLHQFLQLKHGCKLSSLSLKSVFISNISFFNKYENLLGLTGTLGSDADRNFLTDTYGVDLLVIPTEMPSKFIEEEPIDCSDTNQWQKEICSDTFNKIKVKRSVLIICAHISEAEKLHKFLCSKNITAESCIRLYRRECEGFAKVIDETQINCGTVIISTNLAGRGADFVLTTKLKDAGGLHVIFAYIPNNTRVRGQGFGRAARNGDPGSGRLIFITEPQNSAASQFTLSNAMDHVIAKDHQEMLRISEITRHRESVVSSEEDKFSEFRDQFDIVCKNLDADYRLLGNPAELEKVKEIVKQNILDRWALWLDRYSTNLLAMKHFEESQVEGLSFHQKELAEIEKGFQELKNLSDEVTKYSKQKTIWTKIGLFSSEFEKRARHLVSIPPMLNKLGLLYVQAKKYAEASECFSAVMNVETENSLIHTAARCAKVFCDITNSNTDHDKIKSDAYATMAVLKSHFQRAFSLQNFKHPR